METPPRQNDIKAGILTYHFSENFGAVLQAYALQRWLRNEGINVSIINYHPAYVEDGSRFKNILNLKHFKTNIKALYLKSLTARKAVFGKNPQSKKFETFKRTFLNISEERHVDGTTLKDAVSNIDILIAGSDQIWNPSGHVGLDPVYFLSFDSDDSVRKISYAASFGKEYLETRYYKEAEKMLNNLSAISVREESGVTIVKEVSNLSAHCVPDPTLLHTEYSELLATSTETQTDHVFCYALRTGDGIREVANKLSNRIGAPIISPYNAHRRWTQIGKTVYAGPQDWLKLLKNSAYVVTNSFHATVFAIIFEKPFIAVGLPFAKESLNARVINLLKKLNLSHRFVSANNIHECSAVIDHEIDWSAVRSRRELLKHDGEFFLLSQLDFVRT